MKPAFKSLFIALFLFCSIQIQAKAQKEFIDSIRNMLVDLDSSIQFEPINGLLKKTIPYCTGDSLNDSLTKSLNLLISEDYIYMEGLRQAVSPHLVRKYATFFVRISRSFAQLDSLNTESLGIAMIVAARE